MDLVRSTGSQTPGELVYVGIATVLGRPQPVYRAPVAAAAAAESPALGPGDEPAHFLAPAADSLGVLSPGEYVPHFTATEDHAWLNVTMRDGRTGWLRNDPENILVHLPDPTTLRVCIDPGHGGTELGAVGNGLVESEINLDIALRAGALLAGAPIVERVWYTRTGNETVSLKYRWDLANAAFAALFVSIHNNASANAATRGTETYFKCGREGGAWLTFSSARAACLIHDALRSQIQQFGGPFCPWIDGGVICRLVSQEDPRSYYYVLQNTNLPAVLAECLYISNPADALCLSNAAFRDLLAQGIYQGALGALLNEVPPPSCSVQTRYGL